MNLTIWGTCPKCQTETKLDGGVLRCPNCDSKASAWRVDAYHPNGDHSHMVECCLSEGQADALISKLLQNQHPTDLPYWSWYKREYEVDEQRKTQDLDITAFRER